MEILSIILGVLAISFLTAYVRTLNKLTKVLKVFSELAITHKLVIDSMDQSSSQDIDIHKENFIKFLSDSREWAYSYIEDVQVGLKSFIKEVEPSINYFNKYGVVTEGMPHYKDMKKISEEFYKLKKLLPEEIDDRR
jgi:hypothetical protein